MHCKNTKSMVCSHNSDTDTFDMVTGVLQGDSIAPYFFIICLDYVFPASKDLIKKMALHKYKQEVDSFSHKLLRMQTMKMI